MKVNHFEPDNEVMLRTVAVTLAQQFAELKRIGDETVVEVFHGLVPEEQLVPALWPYLGEALESDGGNGICYADIKYISLTEKIEDTHATAIVLRSITEEEHRKVLAANEERRKAAEE